MAGRKRSRTVKKPLKKRSKRNDRHSESNDDSYDSTNECKIGDEYTDGHHVSKKQKFSPELESEPSSIYEDEAHLVDNDKFKVEGSEGTRDNNMFQIHSFSFYNFNKKPCSILACKNYDENQSFFLKGEIKHIYGDDDSEGVLVHNIGPIREVSYTGFDQGEKVLVIISTDIGDYYLGEPSLDYEPFYQEVREKAFLLKYTVELLLENATASYSDLIDKIEGVEPPYGLSFTSEDLVSNGRFIVQQILGLDAADEDGDRPFITSPCISRLVKLCGFNVNSSYDYKNEKRNNRNRNKKDNSKTQSTKLSTTTPLISCVMQECDIFRDQIALNNEMKICGNCITCNKPDCGKCSACIQNKKAKIKKHCLNKVCLALALKADDDDEDDDDGERNDKDGERNDEDDKLNDANEEPLKLNGKTLQIILEKIDINKISEIIKINSISEKMDINKISEKNNSNPEWVDKSTTLFGMNKVHYSMKLNGKSFEANDFVNISSLSNDNSNTIARIVYMFENENGKQFHAQIFCLAENTILGQMAAKNELCMTEACKDLPLERISNALKVDFKKPSDNWRLSGGQNYNLDNQSSKNQQEYYYQKWYEKATARFVDPPIDITTADRDHLCAACYVSKCNTKLKLPVLLDSMEMLEWQGVKYKVGDCIYVNTGKGAHQKIKDLCSVPDLEKEYDEDEYPEYYRKKKSTRGLFTDVPRPFQIGKILSFTNLKNSRKSKSILKVEDIEIDLEIFLRPEDTNLSIQETRTLDYNLLFWTGIRAKIKLSSIAGKCDVVYGGRMQRSNSLDAYFTGGPNRFYFIKGYNKTKCATFEIGKDLEAEFSMERLNVLHYPVPKKKLAALDVFCGCGGLSEGFHQAGISETKWAIENNEFAAKAFKKNNPDATVFSEDCNLLLQQMLRGETHDSQGRKLPQKGEVDIILGGPPCQGYSGMNRFNKREYSALKNSLVATYLSFAEFLRPKFFLLENVKTFTSYNKGNILKCVLRSLIEMGYQVTCGVLQAGNYGVPQSRNRLFILAAAPNEKLPFFPEPSHVFSLNSGNTSCKVDDVKYFNNIQWKTSAPFRQVTVYDGISDLSLIDCNGDSIKKPYPNLPKTQFQRMMRRYMKENEVSDHICKKFNAINVARFEHIPIGPGCDWRDLPNIVVTLPNGTKTPKLEYLYHDTKNGRSSTGAKRGVCFCAQDGNYDGPHKDQSRGNTLIPWCLPHSGNRSGHWAGLFGRLHWYGYFGTTITNPEPMGKCGGVLHPDQHRVVSTRECARSQGFPDSYIFEGPILMKYCQVGNAVPPPLAKAIASEFLKCFE